MSLKNKIFTACVRGFEAAARLPGRRFYWKFMPRFVETLDVTYPVDAGGKTVRMRCTGEIARVRAETFLSKEPDTIAWIDMFASDDVLLDIGANVGVYTLYASAVRGLRTISVEPSAANLHALIDNIRLNGVEPLAHPVFAVAGETTGFVKVRANPVSNVTGGSGMMEEGGDMDIVGWDNAVPTVNLFSYTVDDLVYSCGLPFPAHMKVDVIGTTASVIRGAARYLADSKLKSAMIEKPDGNPEEEREIIEIMARNGFETDGRIKAVKLNMFFRRKS